MTTEEYFGMIINILMGLTFIVLVMIFLYMIYGEKEGKSSSLTKKLEILQDAFVTLQRFYFLL